VLPRVSIVFLVYNRGAELRTSLKQMLFESDYDPDRVEVIVVDNASEDDAAAIVESEFPQVKLIRRDVNCGVSGWNDGFALASGDYVLALDDDCYLPGDGLRRAVEAAAERGADLVSFGVRALDDPEYRFNERYRTGLLTFWGCAVLMRRDVLEELGGYDPEIFVWANELEFMMRFFDHGFRHLHLPELQAVHMKDTGAHWIEHFSHRSYRINANHFAYCAGKTMRWRDSVGALVALVAIGVRDGIRHDSAAFKAVPESVKGFVHGLRHRQPVRPEVSRAYRMNFHSYASPWWVSRPPVELVKNLPEEILRPRRKKMSAPLPDGRVKQYYAERARYYPDTASTLQFSDGAEHRVDDPRGRVPVL
jgi:GT2 family glycosyltransferase